MTVLLDKTLRSIKTSSKEDANPKSTSVYVSCLTVGVWTVPRQLCVHPSLVRSVPASFVSEYTSSTYLHAFRPVDNYVDTRCVDPDQRLLTYIRVVHTPDTVGSAC